MSQMTWICCPGCGSIDGPVREGEVGVPPGRLGTRRRTSDSSRFRCTECGTTFHSDGATRREVMGYNVSGRDKVSFPGEKWEI